jgi:site-specific DNA-methyltransferase (adenine-specific)
MILCGDVLEQMATLDAASVQTVITSPPYWGLRDYQQPGQIGLEKTPEAYVTKLVEVFQAIRRVLKDDGTVWLNLGDSYIHKQLQGIPWRVAFALQADGWYLRSDITWAQQSCMPESVSDRPTRAHEYLFLLSKKAKYFYGYKTVQEETLEDSGWAKQRKKGLNTWKYNDTSERMAATGQAIKGSTFGEVGYRNKRSVWHVAMQLFPDAHFAVMPEALVEPCVLAGSKVNDLILDPFCGSGTVGVVALKHGRQFIGIDLHEGYCQMAKRRIYGPLFSGDN